jgi:peptidylprolyl isomerase
LSKGKQIFQMEGTGMTQKLGARLDRRQISKILTVGAAGAVVGGPAFAAEDPSNTLYLQLKDGRVVIRLRPDLAPKHVEQIKTLVKRGFYNGIVFHRVIEGFMAQTGDPTGTGTGGSDLPNLPAEFSQAPFQRGTLGMARSRSPDSANSQFFICFAPAPFLNGQYTVFGEVVSGMEFVDRIKRGEPVENPDKIISLKLASDAR